MTAPPLDSIPATIIPDTVTRTWLALGDSYTIGTSVTPAESYPLQTTALLKQDGENFQSPRIIATNGWTTVNLLDALGNVSKPLGTYDIVTVLIGVNDQYQGGTKADYAVNFTNILQKAIVYAGNRPSHVIVISIPDYSVTPFGQSGGNAAAIAVQIDAFNAVNRQVATSYQTKYLDVTGESRKAASDPSLIASDNLHFTGKEYAAWSALLALLIRDAVKQ